MTPQTLVRSSECFFAVEGQKGALLNCLTENLFNLSKL